MAARDRARLRQERVRKRRRHDDRHEQRRHQRDDVRHGQRRHQPSFHTGQAEDWKEDEDDDDRREHDRRPNLERGVANHVDRGPPLVVRLRRVLAQPAHHVLHVDDRIVHERADGDGHASERHRVDRGAKRTQHEHRRGERQRHRRERDRGRPQIREKQQDNDDDQYAAIAQGRDEVVDGHFDEVGLPEHPAIDRHPARQFLLERVELAIEPPRQLDGVRARLFLDSDDHRRLSAPRSLPSFQRRSFADVGDVTHEHRARAAQRHDALPDLLGASDAADGLQHVLLRTFGVDAGRRVLTGAADRIEELGQRNVVGAELLGMRDHLELALGAADRRHLRDARHGEEPAADHRVRDRTEGQRIIGVGRNRQEQNFSHDRGDRRQHGPFDLRRQRTGDERQFLGDDLPSHEDVRAPIEFHPDDGDAERSRRADASHG